MVRRVIRVAGPDPASIAALEQRFAAVRQRLGVPEAFPPDVLAAAEEASRAPALPAEDLTDIPFVTVDPPGSTDLDQAMPLCRRGAGYHVRLRHRRRPRVRRVRGPVDLEARRRGQTALRPRPEGRRCTRPSLSEGAASLLEGQVRPAFVWRSTWTPTASVPTADVVRAMVRSRRRLDYGQVQAAADDVGEGSPDPATTSPGRPCCCGRSASGGWPSRPLEAAPTCRCPSRR